MPELRYQDIKSAAYIDAIIHYAETLLGIRLKNVKKYRYSSICPFYADTKESLMVYVNKKDEVRFHCFGACKGDWDIYDVIMLRKKCRFRQAQQVWAEHLGVKDFKSYDGSSPCIPISPLRRRAFSKVLMLSTSLSHTTGTRQAETASNGLRPN